MRIDRIWMVPYDPSWAQSFADQAGVVSGVLAEHLVAPVEHIGSTEARDLPEERLSFCFPSREHRSHHLHVVLSRHPGWRGWLAFRDRLRRDGAARAEYAALKESLAERFGDDPNDRDGYRSGKADFITRITAEELGITR